MNKYTAWGSWMPEGEEYNGRPVEAYTSQDAAEEYVRLNFANLDYPEEKEVTVRDEFGNEFQYTVRVHAEPVFVAEVRRTAKR